MRLVLASLFLVFSGCSLKTMALRSTTDLMVNGMSAFYEESDVAFAETSMLSNLKLVEVFLKNDPTNRDLNFLAAQGFGAYAFLFLESKDAERAKVFYRRGMQYGFAGLKKCWIDLEGAETLDQFEARLKKISKKNVPLLFWTAYSWGGLSNLSRNDSQALANLPKIEKMMQKVRELCPEYFYGGAELFLGSYYGSRPKMFGGSLEKSQQFFEEAIQFSDGKFLMGLVLYAQYYAVPSQDSKFYKKLLDRVLAFPTSDFKEQMLSNTLAQNRAKKMLKEIHDKF